jgi:protocatechuate 3,4-dioxygenase beta subunit
VIRAWGPVVASCVLALGVLLTAGAAAQSDRGASVRTLEGQVTDGSNAPVADAVVYLKNTKDLTVKTYITDKQGNYRFNALSPNADYEVHAEVQDGRRSEVRRLSAFDSRKLVHLNLRVK